MTTITCLTLFYYNNLNTNTANFLIKLGFFEFSNWYGKRSCLDWFYAYKGIISHGFIAKGRPNTSISKSLTGLSIIVIKNRIVSDNI